MPGSICTGPLFDGETSKSKMADAHKAGLPVVVWTFRPEANAARFARSAKRLALPEMSEDDFVDSLKALVAVDSAWVPEAGDGAASCIDPVGGVSRDWKN